ncbi:MAG: cytochrome C oxidase subunit IV family protein [Dehalococcoidia bacterium]|nr:cytochrome C oxidase subunit IV family protein [Dehalococcoidia bacterium]MDW8120525.1 cytochrome C oxidase subunit IV family protein [Chloroflexota bacterium]
MAHPSHTPEQRHVVHKAGPKTCALVALVLTVITLIEVGMFPGYPLYFEAMRPVLVPLFLLLGAGKFALVAAFYMHLKYDTPILAGIFAFGMTVGTAIVISVIQLFRHFHF